jgi:ABC-type glycerol-3-phosphate transport system substrate-binding protein
MSASAAIAGCSRTFERNPVGVDGETQQVPGQGSDPRSDSDVASDTEEPQLHVVGAGPVEIEIWYQWWAGAHSLLERAAERFVREHGDATIQLRGIGYSDLFLKMLPAIAAGDEGDIIMVYTNWVAATDITQVFLDLTEPMGGYARLVDEFWEPALRIVDMPEHRAFYLPWLAGARGSTLTVNRDHLAEDGVDPLDFRTWEEVVDAGRELSRRDEAGAMTRAGYAVNSSQLGLLHNMIWQLGGDMYHRAAGRWSWYSDEGIEGTGRLRDLHGPDGTSSYELYASEFQGVSDGIISIWGEGAWTASVQKQTAGIATDNVVTPRVADGVADDLHPGHLAGWGLSPQLAADWAKLAVAAGFARAITEPDAMVPYYEDQSSLCATKAVYEDSRIEYVAYGSMSKRVATEMWPRARYTASHVSEMGPASLELDRALRGDIGVEEALRNMDAYCQSHEDEARDRIAQ